MRSYIIITGVVFALIALAHVARVVAEGTQLLTEPVFLLLTVAAAGMALWAWRLLRRPLGA